MPAISFQRLFLDALLRGDKHQTTRKQTDRIKVGDVCNIYIEQRTRITDKPLRTCTKDGKWDIRQLLNRRSNYPYRFYDRNGDGVYPHLLDWGAEPVRYHAHFIGKVEITGVYHIRPCEMCGKDLKAWAQADGFKDFHPTAIPPDRLYDGANMWFQQRYGNAWMTQTWTVIKWNGWVERYFEPEGDI